MMIINKLTNINESVILDEDIDGSIILTEGATEDRIAAEHKELFINFIKDTLQLNNAAEVLNTLPAGFIESWLPKNFKFQELREGNNLLQFLNIRPEKNPEFKKLYQDPTNFRVIFRYIFNIYATEKQFVKDYYERPQIIMDYDTLYSKYNDISQMASIVKADIDKIDGDNFDKFLETVRTGQIEDILKNTKYSTDKRLGQTNKSNLGTSMDAVIKSFAGENGKDNFILFKDKLSKSGIDMSNLK